MDIELLAPAGDFNKLKTAFYFGADAVYIGGKAFSLRALAGNFTDEEILEAVSYAHKIGKKVYVTVNILARNSDLKKAEEYFSFLEKAGVDAAIISDVGLLSIANKVAPKLEKHLSTQASALNSEAVKFFSSCGVKRVILARELSLKEVKEIKEVNTDVDIECFIHGAMCISYSGRCLLSNYLAKRDSNRGECVQACRWEYEIREKNKKGDYLTIEEDGKGTYILNSKDLNLIDRIDELAAAGVSSFKIEGRMKSEYYLATVINAYRRAIDEYKKVGAKYKENPLYREELIKTAHRDFTEAYFSGENPDTVNYNDSQSKGERTFIANVITYDEKGKFAVAEMRNRFKKGDVLEVLSPNKSFNEKIVVDKITDLSDNIIDDVKLVQQKVKLFTDVKLSQGDFLRK